MSLLTSVIDFVLNSRRSRLKYLLVFARSDLRTTKTVAVD